MIIAIKPPRRSDAITMERHELHNKIVQQLRFHRISGLDEEECANNILSIVQKDWSEGCSCYHGDTTGETWCCNTCGKPTPRLSTGLPSDEEIEGWLMVDCGGTSEESAQIRDDMKRGAKWMRSIASARIAEVEDDNKRLRLLLTQYSEFRAECTALNDPAIIEIDDKIFPF